MSEREEHQVSGAQGEDAAKITGGFTTVSAGSARPPEVTFVPPPWLMEPALAVLDDLQAAGPIDGLQITAHPMAYLNGLTLALVEPSRRERDVVQLSDDLDPDEPTEYGGGNWVPRSLTGPGLLVLIAEILQEDLAETEVGWGQARPPCNVHPHPAVAVVCDHEAWWVCPRERFPLYRVGVGAVPRGVVAVSAHRTESRRAGKRRHR